MRALASLVTSFANAARGFAFALKRERNLKIHLAVFAAVVAAAALCGFTVEKWLILLLCSCFVVTTELINTAMEALVDLVTEEKRLLAGFAKDVAAAACLVAAVVAVICGLLLFLPYIV